MLANLSKLTKDTIIVLELDSWKLQGFGEMQISPDISVLTTFFPDHMNYYKSNMQKYFEDKAYIFSAQNKKDFLIAGEQVLPIIKKWEKKRKFKIKSKIITPAATLPKGFALSIVGQHNIYNASLAVEVARLLRIKDAYIKKSLKSFKGVSGRLEFIRNVDGVKYYNDTTATTAEASVAALRALGENHNIVLIAGGSDKGLDMNAFVGEIPKYAKVVVLLSGTGTDKIKKYIKNYIEVSDFKKAVHIAKEFTQKGDVVLLSPGFASFGMFKNEYDRGDQFVKIVNNLK
jgi:UDP-N-acetylmuramoylalanine--D-glutamate ligase